MCLHGMKSWRLLAPMPHTAGDAIRAAAMSWLTDLIATNGTNVLPWRKLTSGFSYCGETVLLANRPVGIFKPEQITDGAPLSIKQVCPSRAGRFAPYDDRELSSGILEYHFERSGPESCSNRYLATAAGRGTPLILLRGVADALYEVIFPVFIRGLDPLTRTAQIHFGEALDDGFHNAEGDMVAAEPLPRVYRPVEAMVRGHQAAFRTRVLMAYGYRCALTGFPLPDLLEAAHIIPDSRDGEASVRNGIAMSRLHHAAYERNLLGIDPDGRIHLSETVRAARDGPLLDHGLHSLDGRILHLPEFIGHRPKPEFLEIRFSEFCSARR